MYANATITGFWYTHCKADTRLIKHSLTCLEKAIKVSQDNGLAAEVLASSWCNLFDIGCPFPQVIWPHRDGNHQNMLGQMQSLVALVNGSRRIMPQIVCMLEHDVLYPETYFLDVVKAATASPEISYFCNMNYIGMKETGYQLLIQQDRPMHQTSFRWSLLKQHLESRLSLCHEDKEHMVEDVKQPYATFMSRNPSVHVNTMCYHTSHYNVYSPNPTEGNAYWGDHRQWYPEGNKSPR